MKKNVTVQAYMTTSPHTIGVDQPLSKAKELLRLYAIRHLPVLRGGKLDGVISDRDLSLVDQLEVDSDRLTVEDVMTSDVYEVAATSSLADVATEMATRKLGSAIVVEQTKVIGILTTVDVCAALGELLHATPA